MLPFFQVVFVRVEIGFPADAGFGNSVTIISVIRLVYLIKLTRDFNDVTRTGTDILIWTSVEVNTSIICG